MVHSSLGGTRGDKPFPLTSWGLIGRCLEDEDLDYRTSLNDLCTRYYSPVLFFVRRYGETDLEKARDLVQAFFLTFLEKEYLQQFKSDRGRFRTFLCAALRHFMSNHWRAARAQKRSPKGGLASLEAIREGDERFDPPAASADDPEIAFDQEWKRTLLQTVLSSLRQRGQAEEHPRATDLLVAYELDPDPGEKITYASLAKRFEMTVSEVTSNLRWGRRHFRALLEEEIRDQVASEEDFQREMSALFEG